MLRIKQLPTFDSTAAGAKNVVDLPLGLRYHAIWLRLGNIEGDGDPEVPNALTDLVEDIVVKINGKPQRTHSGTELNQLNSVNGVFYLAQAVGTDGFPDRRLYLPIYFAEPWRKNPEEVSAMALRTNGIESFQVEVNLKAGLAAPVLDGWYEFDYDSRPIGLISKFIRQDTSAVGTSRDITTIDKRDFIESIHLFPVAVSGPLTEALIAAGAVNEIKLTANGEEIRDKITFLQNYATLVGRELRPDPGFARYDLVFDYDDPVNGALPTGINGKPINELTLKITWNSVANGTQRFIVKRTGPIE
jgi:hypothetical protein